jgi:hypothetical protein
MIKGSKMKLSSRKKMSKSRSSYKHWNWKGGETIPKSGYKMIKIGVGNGTYGFEHRIIMEKHLGRKLKPFPIEIVHHKNGDKLDNRIENLEVITASKHAKKHFNLYPVIELRRKNSIIGKIMQCSFCLKGKKIHNMSRVLCRPCYRRIYLGNK